MTAVLEQLNEFREQQRKLKEQIKESAKQMFKDGSAELFEKHSKLNSFAIKSYTIYFNDGAKCYHSAHLDTIELSVEGFKDDDYFDGIGRWDSTLKKTVYPDVLNEKEAAGVEVLDFLKNFEDEDILNMFDDHVKIIVSRSGVEVEGYTDHD